MKADPETEAAILATFRRAADAYASKDVEALVALFSPDAVLLGTGLDEKRVGHDELRFQFTRTLAQAEAVHFSYSWTCVGTMGDSAWAAVEGEFRWHAAGRESILPIRISVVLRRRNGEWLWIHAHASNPYPDQPPGQSWPTSIEALAMSVSEERPDLTRHSAPDGTVTLLFTDIENSTNLTERLGDTQWLDVLRDHNRLVREQVKAHSCFEVKSQGDGFMIASQSARRAVHCAIGIQRELASHAESEGEPIRVRMGLHTGEVLKDADDFFGKHVILASRIAGKARGGEIPVSSLLRDLTESAGDIRFGREREVELKGLSGTHRTYEVLWAQ